ncbi:dihydroflavonol 4-reductase-like [Macadamia integrifolia]|uniref:dihydroflavonol 4-reductase-like n=1 Tax=Macadamia integrifolia TaxID=60698 RepID=UPI001C4F19E2|nr:dihydroflavonol 4-reductase-like [Macadamia integrifolia]
MSSMPPSMFTALALILGNEAHHSILKQHQLIHLDDLCNAHFFVLEHPKAEGRYICSSRDITIFELAKMLRERYPEYNIPTTFMGIDESIKPVHFSSKKLTDLGFKFKYTAENIFDGAIRSCREKNLIPLKTLEKPCAAENQKLNGAEEKISAVGEENQQRSNPLRHRSVPFVFLQSILV